MLRNVLSEYQFVIRQCAIGKGHSVSVFWCGGEVETSFRFEKYADALRWIKEKSQAWLLVRSEWPRFHRISRIWFVRLDISSSIFRSICFRMYSCWLVLKFNIRNLCFESGSFISLSPGAWYVSSLGVGSRGVTTNSSPRKTLSHSFCSPLI